MIVAFDLDGTLADITHRLHFIESKPKNYRAFYKACVDDKVIPQTAMVLLALLDAGHIIEIWSGRSDEVQDETIEWLNMHVCDLEANLIALRMRKAGDYRRDEIVKAEWLEALPPEKRPHLAFDDRSRIVDMWRAHGIRCAQVAPGNF